MWNNFVKLLPSPVQLLLYWLIGFLLLLITNAQTLFDYFGGEALQKLGGVTYLSTERDYYLDNLFGVPILGTIAVLLFWGSIGCAVYCLVWFLSNSAVEAKKYNEAANYVKPKGYTAEKFWETNISHILLLLNSAVMMFVVLAVALSIFVPATGPLLIVILTAGLSAQTFYAIGILLVSWTILGHVLYLLLHIFNYARRVVFF